MAAPTEGRLRCSDGTELYERCWALPSPKAVVVIVHGHGEHCGRYDHVAKRLNAERYSVYSYDQRGHGKSPGTMGEVASFSRLVSDLGESLERVREETPGEIQFLFGHSMGGLVLGHYVATRGVSACGVVFSSPVAKVGEDVKPLLQKMSGIVAAVLPGMPVHSVDPEGISRDAEEVRAYKEDPLVYHGSINARTGHQLLTATKSLQQMFGKITKPILVTHGTSDRVVDCAAGRALHAGAGSHDKTLKLYEGAYHEVFNDLDRERFFADVIGWMNERWSTAATRVI